MKFTQLYSGSSGNLYVVQSDSGRRLLIDPGVVWPKIQKALDYNLRGIVGCLVTHSHKDHCKAVMDVLGAGIHVYASGSTLELSNVNGSRHATSIEARELLRIYDNDKVIFEVFSFATNHDCEGSLGFIIRENATGEFMLFATDTSHITQKFKYPFSLIAIECSYNYGVLDRRLFAPEDELKKDGLTRIEETLAKRLLTSHFEQANAMRYIEEFCDISKCRELHLLHLSQENIDKAQARKEFEEKFLIKVETV